MRIIVSGGGTGGHIYPAITLIKSIQMLVPDSEVLYVGTTAGLEADIIPKEGLPFTTVEIRSFERKLSLHNVKTVFLAARGVWHARCIVKKFQPDIVIGTGGYVCGPVLLAASLLKIPTLIQEQNVFAGVTNKILGRFVSKIAVGYAEAAKFFPKNKTIFTGNPIRDAVLLEDRETALHTFGLDPKKLTILISGGSRGARSINRAMIDVHRHFFANPAVQLLHVTGKNEYNDIVDKMAGHGIKNDGQGNIMIKPYLYNMPQALATADLAIFRAGAVGLAELTAKGVPAILVPYPYAAENHQEYNAMAMKKNGAALVIHDKELNGNKLIEAIEDLLKNPEKLQAMAQASQAMGRPQAAADIAALAVKLARGFVTNDAT